MICVLSLAIKLTTIIPNPYCLDCLFTVALYCVGLTFCDSAATLINSMKTCRRQQPNLKHGLDVVCFAHILDVCQRFLEADPRVFTETGQNQVNLKRHNSEQTDAHVVYI